MAKPKWDKKRMEEAMEKDKEKFFDLTSKLNDLMADFGLRAVEVFEASKGESLNPIQFTEVVRHEIEALKEQISDPEFIEIVIKKAKIKYREKKESQGSK